MIHVSCIDELMAPRPAPDLELIWTEVAGIEPSTNGLQGQSSSTQSQDGTQSVVPVEATPSDGKSASRLTKAKGKAHAIEWPSQSSQPAEVTSNQIAFAENNSIYPHLRPRNNTGHVDHIFSHVVPHVGSAFKVFVTTFSSYWQSSDCRQHSPPSQETT